MVKRTGKESTHPNLTVLTIQGPGYKLSDTDLRDVQHKDPDLRQIVQCKDASKVRPDWSQVSPEGPLVKAYWAQWEVLAKRRCLVPALGVRCRRRGHLEAGCSQKSQG